jgi:flagellar hook-length control protein FliK
MTSVSVSVLSSVLAPAAKPSTAIDTADKSGTTGTSGFSATLHRVEKASATKSAEAAKPASKSVSEHADKVDQAGNPEPEVAASDAPTEGLTDQLAKPPATTPAAPAIDPTVKPGVVIAPVTDLKDEPLVEGEIDKDKSASELAVSPSTQVAPSAVQPAAVPLPDTNQAAINTVMQNQAQSTPERHVSTTIDETPLATSIMASITMGKSLEKTSTAPQPAVLGDAGDASKDFSGIIDTAQSKTAAQQLTATVDAAVEQSNAAPELAVKLKAEPEKVAVAQLPTDDKDGAAVTNAVAATGSTPAQPASISSSASATAALQTPVASQDWAKHLGQQLVNFHLKGDQNVQLHLNPANLGPMSITLNVNEHLQATAHFSSHSSQVRSALEQGITQLRDSMAEQGISLGETSVGEQRQQGFAQNNNGKSPVFNAIKGVDDHRTADVSTPVSSGRTPANGEISTYA